MSAFVVSEQTIQNVVSIWFPQGQPREAIQQERQRRRWPEFVQRLKVALRGLFNLQTAIPASHLSRMLRLLNCRANSAFGANRGTTAARHGPCSWQF